MSFIIESNEAGGLKLDPRIKTKKPEMYRVILHNDHYSTMDFVVEVLMKVFHLSAAQSTQIMLDVHKRGFGVCGTYTHDIALTKVDEVHRMAQANSFPLRCSCEQV